jgi:hypothetical protein
MTRPIRSGRLASVGYRIIGKPPPAGAPRIEVLMWLRRYYLRMLPFSLLVVPFLVIYSTALWVWLVAAASALVWVQGFLSLSLRIRREERNPEQ